MNKAKKKLKNYDLLALGRWNTPSVYNGLEQVSDHDISTRGFNLEPTADFMPYMGSMVGFAVTVIIQPSQKDTQENTEKSWREYREYVASVDGPKIVIVQDLDKPVLYGAFWGEVNSSIHRALGCIGTITDGGIRDLDQMKSVGFKALAKGLCVGHAYSHPQRWNCEVEVFGCKIKPGQLIHADQHGFLVINDEDQLNLSEAISFMDSNECQTVIQASQNVQNKSREEILKNLSEASIQFSRNVNKKFNKQGKF